MKTIYTAYVFLPPSVADLLRGVKSLHTIPKSASNLPNCVALSEDFDFTLRMVKFFMS